MLKTLGLVVGFAIVVFGFVDFGASIFEFDLWYEVFGVTIAEPFWSYSHFVEVAIGMVVIMPFRPDSWKERTRNR